MEAAEEKDESEEERNDESEEDEESKDETKRGTVYPLRITKKEQTRHVNLLVTEKDNNWHYSTIKNFSGFLRAQYSKYTGKTFYCYTCLHGFKAKTNEKTREECVLLQDHTKYCKQYKPQRVSYPQNKTLEFTNIQKQLKQAFVGYADFECLLRGEMTDKSVQTGITETSRKEIKYQSHEPASYFTKFVSIDPEFDLPVDENFKFPQTETYVGEDAAENFLDYVQNVASRIHKKYIEKPRSMIYTNEDDERFKEATKCHICDKDFVRAEIPHCHREHEKTCELCPSIVVRDHCHILGVSNNIHINYSLQFPSRSLTKLNILLFI